jgi:hypothetical protein
MLTKTRPNCHGYPITLDSAGCWQGGSHPHHLHLQSKFTFKHEMERKQVGVAGSTDSARLSRYAEKNAFRTCKGYAQAVPK